MRKLLLFLAIAGFSFGAQAQTTLTTAVDFTVTDVHGNSHNLQTYLDDGKHVLIDFFFTTCGPCIASVPTLNDAYETYGSNQADLIFLSIDYNDTDQEVLDYETTYGSLIPAASGLDGGGNQVNSDYGIAAYPTVILIAPNGDILNQDIFPVTEQNLVSAFDAAGIVAPPPVSVNELDENGTKVVAYPNPANNHAFLAFDLERNSDVRAEVFNILGEQVAQITSTGLAAGEQVLTLPVSELNAGNYFVQLHVNGDVASTTKLTVVK